MRTRGFRFPLPAATPRWAVRPRRLAWLFPLGLALLTACSTPGVAPEVDQVIEAPGHASRVEFVVIHYTVSNQARSLKLLTQQNLSAHYLITDDEPARIIQLVPESRAAWHAGVSAWQGKTSLNRRSVGIEIVNRGALDPDQTAWQPFAPSQIERLIPLVRGILARHELPPENVIGHGEIAPGRKVDPGPRFPWKRLAQAGVASWYDEALAGQYQQQFELSGLPAVEVQREALLKVGYPAPADPASEAGWQAVWRAFQMRYRPQRHDGVADAQSVAILFALANTRR